MTKQLSTSTNKWKLFLDDERDPVGDDWIVFRDVHTALSFIKINGMPSYMSLDHDLGVDANTGYDFINMLIDYMMDEHIAFPDGFDFFAHSMNPVGANNINCKLTNFMRFIE